MIFHVNCLLQMIHMYSKTYLKQLLKRRPKIVFKTDNRLMQVKSIAEFCKTFDLY